MNGKNIYSLEFKLFFRSSSAWLGIVVLLFIGLASLYFGNSFISNQELVIEKAAQLQLKNTRDNVEHFGNDIGLVFFHNKFSVANKPGHWAAFANGQRDINPYLISVTMLALEGQLYDTDISNPLSMLFGNMDLSFVFIFLFPLLIIAFTYNLISEDRERGIWPVLKSQTGRLITLILRKLTVRVIAVFGLAALLIMLAILYLQLPVDLTLWAVIAFVFLYLVFWFATCITIISLGRSSNFNASALIAFWVLLCIIIPASLNLFLTQRYPVPEALQNVINQREGYHEKWDMPKEVTMKPFFEHYPQLKKYPFPEDLTFSWYWYYGMQQMGDDQAKPSRKAMEDKLLSRQRFSNNVAMMIPSIQTQLAINELAGSDLDTHLAFQNFVRAYHEKIRLKFYPAIFKNEPINSTGIEGMELRQFQPQKVYGWHRLLPMFILNCILIGCALLNLKKLRQFK